MAHAHTFLQLNQSLLGNPLLRGLQGDEAGPDGTLHFQTEFSETDLDFSCKLLGLI